MNDEYLTFQIVCKEQQSIRYNLDMENLGAVPSTRWPQNVTAKKRADDFGSDTYSGFLCDKLNVRKI